MSTDRTVTEELRDVVITETPRVVVVVPARRRAITAGMQAYVTSYWNHYTALPETFTDAGGTPYSWQDIWGVFIDNALFGLDVGVGASGSRVTVRVPDNYPWNNAALP